MFGGDWDDAINNKPFATSGGTSIDYSGRFEFKKEDIEHMLSDGTSIQKNTASVMEEARKTTMNSRMDAIERGLEELANKIDILMKLANHMDGNRILSRD